MTYFAFLALFIGIPVVILSAITIMDYRRGKWQPKALAAWQPWVVMLGLCVVAFLYTTPWDNYLVATGVWFYNPSLVTGIIIGYVPLEEYVFFIVLPVMTGLWTLLLMRYLPVNPLPANNGRIRTLAAGLVTGLWLLACILFLLTFAQPVIFQSWTYLTLLLAWALIPIIIQLAFGADILWRHKWVVFFGIAIATVYLGCADAIAISHGTWAIDPAQSLPVFIGGVLPIEEFIFFGIVNTLVVMGMILVLAEESQPRAIALERYTLLRPLIERTLKKWQPTTDGVS